MSAPVSAHNTLAFQPIPLHWANRALALGNWYFDPVFLHDERVNMKRPALFVGNHTLYGLMDVPFILHHLRQQHGVVVRSLGDRAHFQLPGWRELFAAGGAVLGSPENCRVLMNAGESILVFPGGAREVMRRRGEKYQLIWKQRTGFARMAVEQGYDIIPFASLGPDDALDIHWDANAIACSARAQRWLARLKLSEITRKGEVLPPIASSL